MINVMPEDTLRILVELMQKMVPKSNTAQAAKGNISQYYGSMHIKEDGLELQKELRPVRNPFAKIAKEARENNGELSLDVSKQMMREAIAELRSAVAEQDK